MSAACQHTPDALFEPQGTSQVFDADEKIIIRAIAQVLKDRGFGEAQIEADQKRLETDYVVEKDWRTKVVATIKKVGRKEREVTLLVITEQKDASPSGWKPKKLLGKEQYEKIFGEIEMQIYREWYKGN
ncbi:MAG: hypothetical protein FJ117_01735 [Deltaproteobacteria bacterium]|nr:hypothetical protein [Deltaproteobacteria bacterium]